MRWGNCWKLLAQPFCWTKFPKKSRNLKRSFRNFLRNLPRIFRVFLAGRRVLQLTFTRFFPSEISNSKSNFTKEFTSAGLAALKNELPERFLVDTLAWLLKSGGKLFGSFCQELRYCFPLKTGQKQGKSEKWWGEGANGFVPKNRNRRKIAAFSNRKVLNRRVLPQKLQKNRRKIASDFLGRGIEIAAFLRFQIAAFSGR